MEYEEYIDVKKVRLKGLTYDQIFTYLKNAKKEDRLEKYKALLKFRNIPFEADLFTWNNEDLWIKNIIQNQFAVQKIIIN